jgi:glycosyltransferase involved in cell wall biosynthesis
VIPNGIDVDFYNNLERDWNLRRGLGIEDNNFAIICVSNLHINKGHEYLLEAFENIYKENKNVKLLIVGDGNEKESLLKKSRNYQSKNDILFLGKRADIPRLLKISDIFVLPTLFEGMSNAIMEAMVSGLAVITTDIPENKCLIKNSENGILVPIKNASVIKDALIQLIKNKDLRTIIASSAKNYAKKSFSIDIIIKKWNSALI